MGVDVDLPAYGFTDAPAPISLALAVAAEGAGVEAAVVEGVLDWIGGEDEGVTHVHTPSFVLPRPRMYCSAVMPLRTSSFVSMNPLWPLIAQRAQS